MDFSHRNASQLLLRLQNTMQHPSDDKTLVIGTQIEEFRRATSLSRTEFARRLQVAPQTVGRWETNRAKPRRNQLLKFRELLPVDELAPAPLEPESERESISRLGIHLSDFVIQLEKHATEVWIIKSGRLREADRGFIGESILEALQNGVHLRYVFLEGTAADKSFRHELQSWVKAERVSGSVIGYCIKSHAMATEIGLSNSPCAWVLIEYSAEQRMQFKRRLDVFMALSVREYLDTAHLGAKNEDGQPCWIELATPRASEFAGKFSSLKSLQKSNSDVEFLR